MLEQSGGLPSFIPSGSEVRIVKLTPEDMGQLCGGTHVGHISAVKRVEITKIAKK